eukprot:gene5307-18551_t
MVSASAHVVGDDTSHSGRSQPPCIQHAVSSRVVKGEDVMFVHELPIECQPPSMVFMVCDGHAGVDAAAFVSKNFLRLLTNKLPAKLPPINKTAEVEAFAEHLRKALCETFVRLDSEWSKSGHTAGTTVTAVVTTGWLVTVANTGDSAAIIDTGSTIVEVTRSHRIHTNTEEQARLRAAGCNLASLGFHLQGPAKAKEKGVGPMRIWPGGLCVSRSIGDLDAGKEVVPVPHIRQFLVPVNGARLVIASDGLWDVLSCAKAARLIRTKPEKAAAAALLVAVQEDQRVMDDASIIVLDILPATTNNFPTVFLKAIDPTSSSAPDPLSAPKASSGGGFFSCFHPEVVEKLHEAGSPAVNGALKLLADVDCLEAYPGLKMMLANARNPMSRAKEGPSAKNPALMNYSLHGGTNFIHMAGPSISQNIDQQPDPIKHASSEPIGDISLRESESGELPHATQPVHAASQNMTYYTESSTATSSVP